MRVKPTAMNKSKLPKAPRASAIRAKLTKRNLSESDVREAVAWVRGRHEAR